MSGERGGRRSPSPPSPAAAARLRARGVVQGVGFRPFVYSLAWRHGLAGWVRNTSAGVEIHVEGHEDEVEAFVAALPREAPPRAHIAELLTREPAEPEGAAGFAILGQRRGARRVPARVAGHRDLRRLPPRAARPGRPALSRIPSPTAPTAVLASPSSRTCPTTGERTTMRRLPDVPACRREYEDPLDRRFHAEPTACPVCGPRTRAAGPRRGRRARGCEPSARRRIRPQPSAPPPPCCAAARSWPSRASAASISPATPPTATPCAA